MTANRQANLAEDVDLRAQRLLRSLPDLALAPAAQRADLRTGARPAGAADGKGRAVSGSWKQTAMEVAKGAVGSVNGDGRGAVPVHGRGFGFLTKVDTDAPAAAKDCHFSESLSSTVCLQLEAAAAASALPGHGASASACSSVVRRRAATCTVLPRQAAALCTSGSDSDAEISAAAVSTSTTRTSQAAGPDHWHAPGQAIGVRLAWCGGTGFGTDSQQVDEQAGSNVDSQRPPRRGPLRFTIADASSAASGVSMSSHGGSERATTTASNSMQAESPRKTRAAAGKTWIGRQRGAGMSSRDLPLLVDVGLALDREERALLEGGRQLHRAADLAARIRTVQALHDKLLLGLGLEPVRLSAAGVPAAEREPTGWESAWAARLELVAERVAALDEALSGAVSGILLLVQGLYSRRRRPPPLPNRSHADRSPAH
jgi:hypothetical protein